MWIRFFRLGLVFSGGFCEQGAGNFLSRWVSFSLQTWLHDFGYYSQFQVNLCHYKRYRFMFYCCCLR